MKKYQVHKPNYPHGYKLWKEVEIKDTVDLIAQACEISKSEVKRLIKQKGVSFIYEKNIC